MNLYIMSRGRVGKVTTLQWIPHLWRIRTTIVCSYGEIGEYGRLYRNECNIVEPPRKTNYSEKFQYIMDSVQPDEKLVILDDDLIFSRRSPDNPRSLISLKPGQTAEGLFEYMEELLNDHTLVGVHPRQMGQNTRPPFVENGRIICVQGINQRLSGRIRVDQFPILADVVLNCTLLARGQGNVLVTTWFQDHGPCQASGGCSVYRTPEMQHEAVRYLQERFPGFVKVVERRPKVAKWMGDVRYDYTCQWKKLYAAGVAYRSGNGPTPDMETYCGRPAIDD